MSGTFIGTTQSVCVVETNNTNRVPAQCLTPFRHVCWYNSVCLCCFRESLRRQARVLVPTQSVCVVSGSCV